MSDKTSIVCQINEAISQQVSGNSLVYGAVTEKAYNGKVVNAIGQDVIMIDDRYDNIFFHKRDGDSKFTPLRFVTQETVPMALCCYCKDAETHDVIVAALEALRMSGVTIQTTGYNHSALDVLKKYFLIDDPLKHEGYNQDYYVFAFNYDLYRYVTDICCEESQ
jgi:hypothetical protein